MSATIDERVRLISEDRVHGAGWLARQAVEALAEAVEEGADPLEAGRALATARPAMGAVAGAVGRVLAAGLSHEQIAEAARALLERRDRAAHSIAVLLAPSLSGTVMTHSASSTVREALVHTPPARVVCTVTAPHEEGRPFADELSDAGLTVELVADDDAAHAVGTVDLLLLGADCVFRDGSHVNRTGTSDLASAANAARVPVVVACETFKLAPFDPPGVAGRDWGDRAPADDPFDLTQPAAIDRYVTDDGIFRPADIDALVVRTPFLRDGYELLRRGATPNEPG